MKSCRVAASFLLVSTLALAPRVAEAAPITFTEQFTFNDVYIGTDSGQCGFITCTVASATVLFDITDTLLGNLTNLGTIFSTTTVFGVINLPLPVGFVSPSTDASGYAGQTLNDATLTVGVRGTDTQNDNVRITAFAGDGGAVLYQNTFSGILGATLISIPFSPALLAQLGADGRFGITVTTFGTSLSTADFNLFSALLQATTVDIPDPPAPPVATPVPEPSTLVLVGLGAAAALRKRLTQRVRN
jgi:hypothetical protein